MKVFDLIQQLEMLAPDDEVYLDINGQERPLTDVSEVEETPDKGWVVLS